MRNAGRSRALFGVVTILVFAASAEAAPRTFSIPAQPLVSALEQLGRQGDLQIVSTPAATSGKESRALQGTYEPLDALRLLLAGTDLTFKPSGAGYVIAALQANTDEPASTNASTPGASPETELSEVLVTGSRIARSGFNAPTPTTMLGANELQQRAAVTIADALNDIPAFAPTTSTGTAGARPFAPGANYANLRSLGPTRTLVLVDGRRFAPTVPSFSTVGANQVDLNLIPPILLERAEVVTGGASAQWGSDAVAGVVNLILNNRFEGLRTDFEKGVSEHGDNAESRAAFLAGTSFASGRGHVTLAGEYYRNEGTGDIYTRDWGRREVQIVANPSPATNGLARSVIAEDTRLATMTTGGLITSGPLKGTAFGPGGTTSTFSYGSLAGSLLMIGGGVPEVGLANDLKLIPSLERYSGLSHAEYEVTDTVTSFVELSYGTNKSSSLGIQPRDPGTITIRTDNAYLPAAVRTRALAAGITSFSFGRISDDIGHIDVEVQNTNFRTAAGLRGQFGDGWTWDGYYQYGVNRYRQGLLGQRINANFTLAADAVVAPSGTIVCRSTLTAPTNGCVPINLFGDGSPSAAAIDYVTGDGRTDTRYVQQVAAVNLRGEPWFSWAGPISVATGLEHRREDQNTTADAISMADGFNQQNPKALRGDFDVSEGYLETVVPLAADQPWAKNIDFNAAARYAHYSSVAGVVTWKGGVTYDVNDWLLTRATRSRDIRAPNIFERGAAPSPSPANVIDPATNTQVAVRQFLIGNPDLKEETANTTSVGLVLKPTFLDGFQLSLDYYKIDLRDAITSVQATGTINLCTATGDPFFCGNIVRNAAGVITRVNSPYVNLGTLSSQGIDLELAYRTALAGGTLMVRSIGTYTLHSESDNGFGVVDRVGEVGTNNNTVNPMPRFRGSLSTTWQNRRFTGTVQLNYINKSTYDAAFVSGVDINDNSVPSRLYTNLNLSVDVLEGGALQVYGAVNNLFSVDPPNVPSTTFFFPTNPAYYDTIGRDFRVGVRASF